LRNSSQSNIFGRYLSFRFICASSPRSLKRSGTSGSRRQSMRPRCRIVWISFGTGQMVLDHIREFLHGFGRLVEFIPDRKLRRTVRDEVDCIWAPLLRPLDLARRHSSPPLSPWSSFSVPPFLMAAQTLIRTRRFWGTRSLSMSRPPGLHFGTYLQRSLSWHTRSGCVNIVSVTVNELRAVLAAAHLLFERSVTGDGAGPLTADDDWRSLMQLAGQLHVRSCAHARLGWRAGFSGRVAPVSRGVGVLCCRTASALGGGLSWARSLVDDAYSADDLSFT
jgi:hypothetical protein